MSDLDYMSDTAAVVGNVHNQLGRGLDAAGLVLSYPGWDAAYLRLRMTVRPGGLAVVVGVPGVGKTTMLGALGTDSATGTPPRGLRFIDDAHLVPSGALATALGRRGALVLAGPHALVERLGNLRRSVAIIELPLVQATDYPGLLHAMVRHLGERAELDAEASVALARHSGGRAGRFVAVAKLAIFLAQLEGADKAGLQHVDEAASVAIGVDLSEPPSGPAAIAPPGRRGLSGVRNAATLAGAALLTTLVFPQHDATRAPSPKPTASPGRAAVAALPLPTALLEVAILVPPGDPAGADRATHIAAALRQSGYRVGDLQLMSGPALAPGVRYFFTEDRSAAATLAASLGDDLGPVVQAPLSHKELPWPGSAEIILPPSPSPLAHHAAYLDPRRVP